MSAEGWTVVTILSAGTDIVAFLERGAESSNSPSASSSASSPSAVAATMSTPVEPVAESGGWAAATGATASGAAATAAPVPPASVTPSSTPTQVMPTVQPAVSQPAVSQPAERTAPAVPADWYKDPSGRFELRYWNGTKWTEHVARAGKQFVDPPVP